MSPAGEALRGVAGVGGSLLGDALDSPGGRRRPGEESTECLSRRGPRGRECCPDVSGEGQR